MLTSFLIYLLYSRDKMTVCQEKSYNAVRILRSYILSADKVHDYGKG